MSKKRTILFLFRVFKEEKFAKEFMKGKIFFNTLVHFNKEEDRERQDKYEGVDFIGNRETVKIIIGDPNKDDSVILDKNNGLIDHILLTNNINKLKKICCFYAVSTSANFSKYNFSIDEKFLDLGNHVILFTDAKEFLRRVESELIKLKYKFKHGLVKYIDINDFGGQWNPFMKAKQYRHQNEFRIMFEGNNNQSEKIDIGDISDIAELVTIEKFLNNDIQIRDINTKELLETFTLKDLLY